MTTEHYMKARPLVSWPGGKTRVAKHLLSGLRPHDCFVDAFCGALGFFLAKPPSKCEVINDIHGDLINLFRQVKYHPEALDHELSRVRPAASWRNARESIRALSERLDKVVIECLPWQKIFKNQDGPRTFFFIDPPYVGGNHGGYKSFEQSQIAELAAALPGLKAQWMLTINDSPENQKLFAPHKIKSIKRVRGINNQQGTKFYSELIVTPAASKSQIP